jgi:thiamine biosynthesis lipoprotein
MSITRRGFLQFGLGAFLAPLTGACGKAGNLASEQMYVFGTLVNVLIASPDQAAARQALGLLGQEFERQNRDWHAWKPGVLGQINQALAAGQSHAAPPDVLAMVESAMQLARRSENLFNPAIGQLISLWGFHSDELPQGELPRAEAVEQLTRQAARMDQIRIAGNRISSSNPAARLDFGGYAKGVSLNLALDTLAALGLPNAIVNLGGNLAVSGDKHGQPWRIGIRHPQGRGVLAAVLVSSRNSVVTSGSYERYREWQGQRYPHIIDPRSGWPAQGVASVSIIHPDAALADAAATALVVAGTRDWPEVARSLDLDAVLVVDAQGHAQVTPDMARRLEFQARPAGMTVVKL